MGTDPGWAASLRRTTRHVLRDTPLCIGSNYLSNKRLRIHLNGGGGTRTHAGVTLTSVFKTGTLAARSPLPDPGQDNALRVSAQSTHRDFSRY